MTYNFANRILASSQAIAPTAEEGIPALLAWSTTQTADTGTGGIQTNTVTTADSTIETPFEPDNAPASQPQGTLMARMSPTMAQQAELAKKTFKVLQKVVVDPAIIEHGPDRKLYINHRGKKLTVVQVGGKYFLDGGKI